MWQMCTQTCLLTFAELLEMQMKFEILSYLKIFLCLCLDLLLRDTCWSTLMTTYEHNFYSNKNAIPGHDKALEY